MTVNNNPKICDHCPTELPQTYKLELIGYKANGKERIMDGKVRCRTCGEYSARVSVFGGAK